LGIRIAVAKRIMIALTVLQKDAAKACSTLQGVFATMAMFTKNAAAMNTTLPPIFAKAM
jgi:hypothetical protein